MELTAVTLAMPYALKVGQTNGPLSTGWGYVLRDF